MEYTVEDAIKDIVLNPSTAYKRVFKHRHQNDTPAFHKLYLDSFFDAEYKKILYFIFRGGAKSSLAEEAVAIGGVTTRFHNCLIISSSETRAADRLLAVRHELQYNESIAAIFGPQVGSTWTDTKLILPNNVMIQCIGQGQDLRGVKHLQWRPDLILFDDLERREDVWTPTARKKMKDWMYGELLPASDPGALFRMNATPLDVDALSVHLSKLPDWHVIKIPIMYKDEHTGELKSSWEDRYPISEINEIRASYAQAGELDLFNREYMMEVVSEQVKSFRPEYFQYGQHSRAYEAVTNIYDPARTTKATSAHTGFVSVSWIKNKLVVWESGGYFWQPSEIIDHIFTMNARYNPILTAVEKDGLEEFIMQPLRQESTKRNVILPIRDVKAPKGKLEFIKGLEPFFRAGEVILVGSSSEHQTLTSQLENFPTGRIDVPNALAYALVLRPGMPIYEDFDNTHVATDLIPIPNQPLFLAVNATQVLLTAVLFQFVRGTLYIYTDFAAEGDPSLTLAPALQHVQLYAATSNIKLLAPPEHFATYDAIGLRAAARAIPAPIHRGGDVHKGRDALRTLLRSQARGVPAVQVSPDASLTLRALAGGYALTANVRSGLAGAPADNAYATLMNGLEAVLALVSRENLGHPGENITAHTRGVAMSPDGRLYRSSRG